MKTPFTSKMSQHARRRLDLAVAVAQERLLGTHVRHALELIELVGGHVPFDDALDIYHRLLRLSEDEARIITTRALAALGEGTESEVPGWPERMAGAATATAPEDGRRSLLEHLRQRLRGRINDEVRLWIELEAARTEVALLGAHVENALNFVDVLEDEIPFTEAIELYLAALDVREHVAEVAYYMALARLNGKVIPARSSARGAARASGPPAAGGAPARPLRLIDGEGG